MVSSGVLNQSKMIKGVKIEKDKSIENLANSVFTQLDKIANPEGKVQTQTTSSGLTFFPLENALKELIDIKKKNTTS